MMEVGQRWDEVWLGGGGSMEFGASCEEGIKG